MNKESIAISEDIRRLKTITDKLDNETTEKILQLFISVQIESYKKGYIDGQLVALGTGNK